MISILDSLCTREQTAVDSVHNRRGANHASTKVTTIQTLDSILTALDLVKLQIYVALRIRVEGDMDNMTIFFSGFLSNVILQFLNPAFTFLPVVYG